MFVKQKNNNGQLQTAGLCFEKIQNMAVFLLEI